MAVTHSQRHLSRNARGRRVFAGGAAIVCGFLLAACNGGGGGSGDGPIPTVMIDPPTANVPKGQPKEFTATVVDAGPNVTWTVEGGAQNGTITASGLDTALYTAPSVLPASPVTIRATSTDDSRWTATASIRVVVGWTTEGIGKVEVQSNVALRQATPVVKANTFSGGQRSIAISGSIVYAVWDEDVAGTEDIYLAVSRDHGVTFDPPIRVNDVTAQPQLAPSVAVDAFGRAVIAWIDARNDPDSEPDNHGYDIYVAEATINGSGTVTVGQNQRVTTGPACDKDNVPPMAPVCDPSVALAVSPVGNIYLAWTDASNGFDMDVMVTKGRRPVSGGLFEFAPATPVHASLPSVQSRPSVAVDSQENVVVAWIDRRSGDPDVYWSRGRFSSNGAMAWATQDVRVNIDTANDQVSPSVAMDQGGVAYVAWGHQVGTGERRKIYFARESGSGDLTVSANKEVLPLVAAEQNFPSLVVSGTDVTIAFADNRGCPACPPDPNSENTEGTGPTDVYLVRSTDGGVNFGDSLLVNTDSGSAFHGRASVVVDDVGRACLIWTDGRSDDPNVPPPPGLSRPFIARVE